jgi:hypothetical protein
MKSKPVEDQCVIRLFRREKDLPGLVRLRIDIEAIDRDLPASLVQSVSSGLQ